jgi:hypothetical protein
MFNRHLTWILRARKTQYDITATVLLAACRLYEMEYGKAPDTLGVLIPKYLTEMLVDPYDGKPFRYSQDRELVYSVREDLIDATGLIPEVQTYSR